ncbi:hypothetical protein C5689_15725 [Methylosinus sporium]|uniref:Uncharacterized protein n=1 Tax=Methylosinus sporium TaxID=428 RepID=A0A2U1SMW7_METSR|nr:hypothetical protein C5689_15725 [Methylosinus sporium]
MHEPIIPRRIRSAGQSEARAIGRAILNAVQRIGWERTDRRVVYDVLQYLKIGWIEHERTTVPSAGIGQRLLSGGRLRMLLGEFPGALFEIGRQQRRSNVEGGSCKLRAEDSGVIGDAVLQDQDCERERRVAGEAGEIPGQQLVVILILSQVERVVGIGRVSQIAL